MTAPEKLLDEMARRAGADIIRLHLLVADRCNHSCSHCYQIQGQKGEMSFAEIVDMLNDFREAGGMILSVSGGEATLRGDLVDILEHARDIGLATILYTNGYSVDEGLADRLAACALWRVDVSVYSHVASDHDALTGVPGSWERSTHGIRLLTQRGVRVVMKATLTRAARNSSLAHLRALATQLACQLQVADHVSAREDGDLEVLGQRLSPSELSKFSQPRTECFVSASASSDEDLLHRAPCGVGSTALTMRSDGSLTPCTNLPFIVSDAARPGLTETVRRSAMLEFLRGITWDTVHGCRDCDLIPLCSRCHASALSESGDMLGPYLGGCTLATARHAQMSGNDQINAPANGCDPKRNRQHGPFRAEADGALVPIPDRVTERDLELVRKFPWIRAPRAQLTALSIRNGPRPIRLRRNAGDIGLDLEKSAT